MAHKGTLNHPLLLPPKSGGKSDICPSGVTRLTVIGGNGAGKSRFMEQLSSINRDRVYNLSALSASFPERKESTAPGSIDMLYRHSAARFPYLRADAVCELDKLMYMLMADEFESLLDAKDSGSIKCSKDRKARHTAPTRLDLIRRLWEQVFPGRHIRCAGGAIMFETLAGSDLISTENLSQGEKAVLYYATAVLYAAPGAVITIESPSLFIHPSILAPLWNHIEQLRPDCMFVYNSVDVDFVNSRPLNTCIWVKNYDSASRTWDYDILRDTTLTEEMFVELAGSRRPVLFIEGDARHSIDVRLYGLVFSDWTVRPLGSCNKVIESTRAFTDLSFMHHLQSRGIVDRDRRTDQEVEYLRRKGIMVPDVAEIENIFLLEPIIRTMARRRGKDASKVVQRVRREVFRMFRQHAEEQVLQHVRHRIKRELECKIDTRATCITALETHLKSLAAKLNPRAVYKELRTEFAVMTRDEDYIGVLRVFNHKPMLPDSGLHQLLAYRSKEAYIEGVLDALRENGRDANVIRECIKHCFHVENII